MFYVLNADDGIEARFEDYETAKQFATDLKLYRKTDYAIEHRERVWTTKTLAELMAHDTRR